MNANMKQTQENKINEDEQYGTSIAKIVHVHVV